MMLNLKEKTGFKNLGNEPIVIYDYRGIPFYDTSNLKKYVEAFNLPEGTYMIKSGDFTERSKPVNFPLNTLPRRQRFFKSDPMKFELKVTPTKHKALVSWAKRLIVVDPQFLNSPLPVINYIVYHEVGHQFYSNESATDAFAENMMLKKGFNPSQIHGALISTLSERQEKRKIDTLNRMFIKQ